MSTRPDSLVERLRPNLIETTAAERVFYANGVQLDAGDFNAEQVYHRGRMARALAYLHGYGTAAGLAVQWQAALAPGVDPAFPDGREESLQVTPGLAIDRLGRLIEVPRTACIRLDRWYQGQMAADLQLGYHADQGGVVVDLFLRFAVCEQGKQPAFATGPYDALDAAVPSRLRDSYQLELVIRQEGDLSLNLPVSPWATVPVDGDPATQRAALRTAILAAWREGTADWDHNGPVPLPEHTVGQDPTALFLARLILPTATPVGEDPPVRAEGVDLVIDDAARLFVYTPNALARLLGIER